VTATREDAVTFLGNTARRSVRDSSLSDAVLSLEWAENLPRASAVTVQVSPDRWRVYESQHALEVDEQRAPGYCGWFAIVVAVPS